jgi:hypothetical protein
MTVVNCSTATFPPGQVSNLHIGLGIASLAILRLRSGSPPRNDRKISVFIRVLFFARRLTLNFSSLIMHAVERVFSKVARVE